MAENIHITFLGTGSSVPTARRNHPALFIKYKKEGILFDCGEGTQRQLRKAKISPAKITTILISHWHGDHVLGLPGLLQTLILTKIEEPITLYGPKGTKEHIKKYLELFINKHTATHLQLEVHEVGEGTIQENEDYKIESIEADHDMPANNYAFITKKKTRIKKEELEKKGITNNPKLAELAKGKDITINGTTLKAKNYTYEEKERRIAVIIDTRYNKRLLTITKNADLLISESTFSEEEQELATERGHLTSKDASTIAKESKANTLALIHLSQRYDEIPKKILTEAKKTFKNTTIPEDLDHITI